MKLTEHKGKQLFQHYGIETPKSVLVSAPQDVPQWGPCVLKAQVHSGDRFKHGGILIVEKAEQIQEKLQGLLGKTIQGEVVERVLVEEKIESLAEWYVSLSYSSEIRGPVLSLSTSGGTGIAQAHTTSIPILVGITKEIAQRALDEAQFPQEDSAAVTEVLQKLWTLFIDECALVAEINPLFKTTHGLVAGDAKIIIDDDKNPSGERRIIAMDGDIAVLASGGGASMLIMDALIRAGGKPANYTEYSGNPPAQVVKELTIKVLSRPGLKGCFVAGAFANFTDIYVTLSGLLEGLREITPKPTYPIVVRRDGPRKDEAFAVLEQAKTEGFDFHLFGSDISMDESAKKIVALVYPV